MRVRIQVPDLRNTLCSSKSITNKPLVSKPPIKTFDCDPSHALRMNPGVVWFSYTSRSQRKLIEYGGQPERTTERRTLSGVVCLHCGMQTTLTNLISPGEFCTRFYHRKAPNITCPMHRMRQRGAVSRKRYFNSEQDPESCTTRGMRVRLPGRGFPTLTRGVELLNIDYLG